MGRVRGVAHGDRAAEDRLAAQRGEQGVERGRVTGDDRGAGAVDAGDAQEVAVRGEAVAGLRLGELDVGDRAGVGEGLQQSTAMRDDVGSLDEGQGAGDDGGCDLAEAVTDDGGRLDADLAPGGDEGEGEGVQNRLDRGGAVERNDVLASENGAEREVGERGEGDLAGGDRAGEGG